MKKVVVFGATSAIAQAAIRVFVARGDFVYLVARNGDKLEAIRRDIEVRNPSAFKGARVADLNNTNTHDALINEADTALGGIDVALIAHGELGEQSVAQDSFVEIKRLFEVNFLSAASLMTALAKKFIERRTGSIAVISSVAGDRGRGSNYVYGSAKGALSIFAAGMRNRLTPFGVHVVTVKPGFVDTPMTSNFKKGPLWASAIAVGKGIVKAIDRNKNEVYLPGFWRLIMFIICSIPEFIFKKLKL